MKALTSRQRGVRRVQVEVDVEMYDAVATAAGISGRTCAQVAAEALSLWMSEHRMRRLVDEIWHPQSRVDPGRNEAA